MALSTVFEKEVCGRCGGCGQYSYNQRTGRTCFGCGGKGERLTKRGAAARQHYVEACSVPVTEVQVGDLIQWGSVTMGGDPYNFKARIEEVGTRTQRISTDGGPMREVESIVLTTTRRGVKHHYSAWPQTKVRKYWPEAENEAKIAEALAYQATLGKNGKPLKR